MEVKRPIVSVIVVTYNHSHYIRQAIDSILMQITNFEYEILIGDDASTDGTQEILQEYQKRYSNVKIYLHDENKGANKNAYRLIKTAKGKYLASLDGDDYWTDRYKLQSQVDFLERNDDFVGCTHKFTIVDENNYPVRKQYLNWVKNKNVFKLEDFKGIYLPGQPSTFLRRNLVYEGLVDLEKVLEIHPMIGDRTAMMLFLMHGNFGLIERNMSCYRKVKEGFSVTKSIYEEKYNSIKSDYKIILKMEGLANLNKRKVDFSEFKKMLFAKSVILFLITLNYELVRLAMFIYKDLNSDRRVFLYVPKYIFKKCLEVLK